MLVVCGIRKIIHKVSCHIVCKIRLCFRRKAILCTYIIFFIVTVYAFVENRILSTFTLVVNIISRKRDIISRKRDNISRKRNNISRKRNNISRSEIISRESEIISRESKIILFRESEILFPESEIKIIHTRS